jgi:hypothetical protein
LSFRAAALHLCTPARLPLARTRGQGDTLRQFKAAMVALKRSARLIRQTQFLLARASRETTRRSSYPVRPHGSRATLWRWYRLTGRNWAQFVADHGPG